MGSTKGSCFYRCKSVISSSLNQNRTKVFILTLSLLSFSFILESIQSFSKVNAQGSLGQTIQQFNNKLRSGIDEQIQSNLGQGTQQPSTDDNNINCNGNNNFVTQSQTTSNGQMTTIKSDCNGSTSAIPSSIGSQR
ncbi:MAG: hypothetical protein ACTHKF_10045 [Candidatus Nitrosocosmicus sp.]